tara:strand:+ start:2881 stop:4533 length:1653 start_codon:yes stop_codon:yes gene_type:complete
MRRWAHLLLLWLLAGPAAAELTATVEPRIIDEFDTARLTIRTTGTNQTQPLGLYALEEDFEVLTTQSSSQYRAVNGQVESWVEYQILLRPRSSGDLTIPPVTVGDQATPALPLRVRGMPAELREAIERMVFFESELTRDPVYVQAQTVLIRRLYYASGAQIYSDLPGMPEIPDAIVMPIGETTSTATIRDGQRYGVIEQRFAILPERSGELTIPAISVTSSVRLQSGGRLRRSGVRVATEPMTLEVLPIPPEYPAEHPWLPAENLTLQDTWSTDQRRLAVGDQVRRTLRAEVTGNVSSAIPPLTPALPDASFRRYPEPPELTDDDRGPSIRGVREQAYAIIPTAPGSVVLPATEVVWWDVAARRVRTASAPGRNLTITGVAAEPSAPAADGRAGEGADAPAAPAPETVQPPAEPLSPGRTSSATLWVLAAAAVLLATLAYALRGRLAPPAAAPSARQRRRTLDAACREGRADAIHDALLDYLRGFYDASLPEAQRRFRADGYGALLDDLNAARFRSGAAGAADGDAVRRAVDALRRGPRRSAEPLPALYD